VSDRQLQGGEIGTADVGSGSLIARVGSWSQDLIGGLFTWSPQTYAMHEVEPARVVLTIENILAMLHPDDVERLQTTYADAIGVAKVLH